MNFIEFLFPFPADNLFSTYISKGEVSAGVEGDTERGEVVQDYTTTFVTLCAIYFPSVTGESVCETIDTVIGE